ncbi:hypothetical protein CLAFUW4_10973 [Fulvia fulva]|uniref:Uncharacterized protein n=1 Tax=Passalora fulva TaxID=5499 RepID=A0A9Q8PD18_PASFU|nr:uncharacterized protein CLAFUR5_10015 [Fulvia fulva]KAK4619710.1 hypothetical protein CLAFUR4_10978 [Fulvia fulva]KAK4620646.1 hypothetical protein CLAFUR0_10985 [Fulvia fulva]UJO20309.1 hypothetical protein CLAFUR5_10015 [Fulvia fulva]WPV17328.1 hypothetical protein CLAFUW4_10973 [Fulvia fulva]WPV32382.1 hypothetical protein CLAFUW7_10971 [Fulvia fulva]
MSDDIAASIGPHQLSVRIIQSSIDPDSAQQHSIAAVSGVIEEVGADLAEAFHTGQEAIAFIPDTAASTGTVRANGNAVCHNPASIEHEQAARMAAAFISAHAFVAKYNALQQASHADTDKDIPTGTSIILTGGETPTTAIISLILRNADPDARILVTAELDGEDKLIRRTDQYVIRFRAYYAIDGSAEDAFTHLEAASQHYTGSKKAKVILDVSDMCTRRPELRDVLDDDGVLVQAGKVGAPIDDKGMENVVKALRVFLDSNASVLSEL